MPNGGYNSPLIFEGYSDVEKAAYRSLLAFWIGGLSATISGTPQKSGYISPLGFWIGGVGSAPFVIQKSGYNSLSAFWVSGASQTTVTPTPPTPEPTVTVQERRWPGPSFTLFREGEKEPSFIRRRKEEEEILFL